ncbi:MAG: hypothetical protein P4L84_22530 [Isosphaeraceae bacterium]|nr:hypothetical protein [Isosphaeraceae bacterium]
MGHGLTTALWLLALGAPAAQPAASERASLPDHYLGLRMQPLLLLTRADVRADVGLDAAQAEEVDKAVLDFVARAAAVRGLQGPAAVEARRAVDIDAQQWLETHLKEAQFRRLVQVDLQWEGPSSLISRPAVSQNLELTAPQRQALVHAVASRNEKRRPGTFHQEAERALAEEARTILTPKQRRVWAAMLGAAFTPQFTETTPAAARSSQ